VIPEITSYNTFFNNTHQLDKLHIHFHFIKTQSLETFRASFAHPHEALHEQSLVGAACCFSSITARYTQQKSLRTVLPEDGQVMPDTSRGFEF
jgi:hypothetical protein